MLGAMDGKEITSTMMASVLILRRKHVTESDNTFQANLTVAIYVLILIFCLWTNIILIYLIITRKFMGVKYIFTVSISVSHILISVVVIPLAAFVHITNEHVNVHIIACDVIVCFCVGVTSHSMLATAIRRCLALSERYRYANFTDRGKVKNIVFVWTFALATSLPYIFNHHVANTFSLISNPRQPLSPSMAANSTKDNIRINDVTSGSVPYKILELPTVTDTATVADVSKTSFGVFSIYNTILLFVHMFVPCLTSLILQTVSLSGLTRRPNRVHWIKEILITKQHICMAAVFLVCWLPLMLTNLISDHTDIPDIVFYIIQPLAMSSVVYFPIIYYFLNAHIKREFLLMIQHIVNREQPV